MYLHNLIICIHSGSVARSLVPLMKRLPCITLKILYNILWLLIARVEYKQGMLYDVSSCGYTSIILYTYKIIIAALPFMHSLVWSSALW
jgi:hypothetical protein